MRIELPYAERMLSADLPADAAWVENLDVQEVPALAQPDRALEQAFANPLGQSQPFGEQFASARTVCIVVSDSFRKTGIDRLLPALLAALGEAGIGDAHISFLFSTGTHRGPTEAEAEHILGREVYRRFRARAYTHDAWDESRLRKLGTTSRGTPVWINTRALDCDALITTGTVVLHYFGGFGGGRKSIVPGIAGNETIARNHALNLDAHEDRLDPAVRIGALDGNPVSEDMREGAYLVPVAFSIQTVLDRKGAIAGLFCGDLETSHRAGAAFAEKLYCVPIRRRARLVIASAGATVNYLQSHKTLFNAYQAMAPGGRMVLATPAHEGLGGNKLGAWLALGSREAVIARLREQAEINGQTALSTLEKAPSALFVSELSQDEIERLGGRKAPNLQTAVDWGWREASGASSDARGVYVLPRASYTVPIVAG